MPYPSPGPKGWGFQLTGALLILFFNANGEYISTLHKLGSLIEPRGILLNSEGNIIVCDARGGCVKFFPPNG